MKMYMHQKGKRKYHETYCDQLDRTSPGYEELTVAEVRTLLAADKVDRGSVCSWCQANATRDAGRD